MPAVPYRPVVVMAPTSPPWMHGVAAGRAELRPLRQHASGDLVFVGNIVIAEPQGIRHAKFTRVALGGSRIQTGEKSDHRQGQAEDETQYPHVFTPKTTRATPALTHPNHEAGWRRWYPGESQMQSELENTAIGSLSAPTRNPRSGLLVRRSGLRISPRRPRSAPRSHCRTRGDGRRCRRASYR